MNRLSLRESIAQACSDMSKDAYGSRKRIEWQTMPLTDLWAEFKSMKVAVEASIRVQHEEYAWALAKWETHISKLMADNSISRATAIRWDMQANDARDLDSYVYHWGMPWDMTHKLETEMQVQS